MVSLAPGAVALVALTDNEPEWEAGPHTPGVHHVAYDQTGLQAPHRARLRQVLAQARALAPFVVVSAHVGPNWGHPSTAMRALAHELLDLGADGYWGHSNHVPQGIELYRGKPILYSTGDFVDDYAVDPNERNDLSFLFTLEISSGTVERIELAPVAIDGFRVRRARPPEVRFLQETMTRKCRAFGTTLEFRDGLGLVRVRRPET